MLRRSCRDEEAERQSSAHGPVQPAPDDEAECQGGEHRPGERNYEHGAATYALGQISPARCRDHQQEGGGGKDRARLDVREAETAPERRQHHDQKGLARRIGHEGEEQCELRQAVSG